MKKLLFATIIAIVFLSGTIVGAIPFATAASTGGNPDRPIINQLNAIGKILTKIDLRLERVLQGIGTNPDQPTIDALMKIRDNALDIVSRVEQKLPTPVPTPLPDIG